MKTIKTNPPLALSDSVTVPSLASDAWKKTEVSTSGPVVRLEDSSISIRRAECRPY